VADAVLTLNAGSSSLKFALFALDRPEPTLIFRGELEGLGGDCPRLRGVDAAGTALFERQWPGGRALTHEDLLGAVLDFAGSHLGQDKVCIFAHRVTHGGPAYADPMEIDDEVLAALDAFCPLAPLHQPHNLTAIRACRALRPKARQIACFDTAFHRTMPAVAQRMALPPPWEAKGVRRYGFHGLSYEYVIGRLDELDSAAARGRTVMAHLGSGASLCAAINGRSVDTTMGFSTLDGLVMGTRCGAMDPGVLLYIVQEAGLDDKALEDLLYRRSGLLGVSGLSADMRPLMDSPRPEAKAAIDLFVFRLVRELGAMTASLQGLDSLVFTAGIGEHAPPIRARVCDNLGWLGVELDAEANARNALKISTADSRVSAWVIPTDEERVLARHALALAAGR